MPYKIRKLRNQDLYSVKNVETGKIHAHATTKANAKKQVKLLQAIDHGFVPSLASGEDTKGIKEDLEGEDLEGGYLGETLVNLYNRIRGRSNAVAPAPSDNINPMGPLAPVNRNGNQIVPDPVSFTPNDLPIGIFNRNQVVPYTEQQIYDAFGIPRTSGSGRMNPVIQSMLTYLQSLYPKKTLISVANEILKITGHKMTGRGRKSPTVTEIAKYVITAIGSALAIALAIFLINAEIEEEKDYQKSLIKIEESRQRERKRMAEEKRMGEEDKKPKSKPFGQNFAGGVRLNSAAKSMITYLQSLYPHKTLMSVANEILKLTGQNRSAIENGVLKMSGKGRKSTTVTEIAMYVIKALGTVLAIAVAIFILSDDDTSISQSPIHPSLNKPSLDKSDVYPIYSPSHTDINLKPIEKLYSDPSLPSYTNIKNPMFKKKSNDKYSEYPSPSGTFSGNPRGYGRKKRLRRSS